MHTNKKCRQDGVVSYCSGRRKVTQKENTVSEVKQYREKLIQVHVATIYNDVGLIFFYSRNMF
jgi:hypothetical protein